MTLPADAPVAADGLDEPDTDHIVFLFLHDLSWGDYEALLRMRGDHSAPRIDYLEGEVEIMRPSRTHEGIKSLLGYRSFSSASVSVEGLLQRLGLGDAIRVLFRQVSRSPNPSL
jgi:hypothetical protein